MFSTGQGCSYVVITGVHGVYFSFDKDEMTRMLGREWTHFESIDIVQKGLRDWSGSIKIQWPDKNPRGRREESWDENQWLKGDTIRLLSCTGGFIKYNL